MTFEFGSDEDVQSLGDFLRRRRQGRDLSLEEVAERIKIHVKYLTAIEEGKDEDLPGHVYKELFLKSYCEFLGISIDELLLRLPEHEPVPAEQEGAEATPQPAKQPAKRPAYAPQPVSATAEAEPQKNGGGSRFLVATLAVLVIVLAIVAVQVYRGELFSDPKSSTPAAAVKKPEPIPEPVVVSDSTGNDTLSSVPAAQEMINLLMVGRGECWIEVSIDGDSSFSELMKTQDTLWFAMQDSISFKLGRANNVDVWCNAQPLALAAKDDGTVRTYTLTRTNYKNYVDSARIVP
ncbi:MAG: DUF4115 domain-containing protein [bacterium]|nr:DUF4115 domain-containing protein [bacterium]